VSDDLDEYLEPYASLMADARFGLFDRGESTSPRMHAGGFPSSARSSMEQPFQTIVL
jgi:hypothetical protein